MSSYLERDFVYEYCKPQNSIPSARMNFENFVKMANVLMPEKFQFGTLFGGLISISGICPISTKKADLVSRSDGL